MRGGGHQVGRKRAARCPFDSMSTIWWCIVWPPGTFHLHAGHDRLIVVYQFNDTRRHQRQEIVGQIVAARPGAGWVAFPLAAADDIPRSRKPGAQAAVRVADGEAARVVPVQVRREDDVYVFRGDAGIGERVIQVPPPIKGEVREGLVGLVPEAGIDEHGAPAADEQLADGDLDAIALVSLISFGPQSLRHDAEDRAAIQPERTVAQGHQFQITQTVTGDFRFQI